MTRQTRTITVSVPPELFDEIDRLAKEEMKTRSELFRDMVGVYRDHLNERRWRRLRRLGEETARRLDISSEADIERLVHEARGIKA